MFQRLKSDSTYDWVQSVSLGITKLAEMILSLANLKSGLIETVLRTQRKFEWFFPMNDVVIGWCWMMLLHILPRFWFFLDKSGFIYLEPHFGSHWVEQLFCLYLPSGSGQPKNLPSYVNGVKIFGIYNFVFQSFLGRLNLNKPDKLILLVILTFRLSKPSISSTRPRTPIGELTI